MLEGLGAGGEGDNKGWDGWMALLTRWTWVWVNIGSWCWTERPGVLHFMGSQRVRHDWVTELYWTELMCMCMLILGKEMATHSSILAPTHQKGGLNLYHQFRSVQLLSRVQLFATPWITARQASLSITISQSSLRLTSIELVMQSSHLILCRPLFLLPPIPPSIRVFSNESTLPLRWPKNWSFSFSIIPSKEHPKLNSFRMDWLDLLAIQGTLKNLLQHHSSKDSL